jgi:hypothetical protein
MYSRRDGSGSSTQTRVEKREKLKQMDRHRSRPGGGRPPRGLMSLLLVSLFVLVVFASGVLVGVNFFQMEESSNSGGGSRTIVGHSAVSPPGGAVVGFPGGNRKSVSICC